jgi:SpoIIAA-like
VDAKHFNQIERVAMVGDKKWQKWMVAFCKPFTTGKVRYFDHEKLDKARVWVTGG